MKDLRKLAREQECQIRLPHVCNFNPETTVLCHFRLKGYCGTAIKPDDFIFGAWGCSACHDVCDGRVRVKHLTYEQIRLAHAEGVMRTQYEIIEKGLLT